MTTQGSVMQNTLDSFSLPSKQHNTKIKKRNNKSENSRKKHLVVSFWSKIGNLAGLLLGRNYRRTEHVTFSNHSILSNANCIY
jgi:hypothetical protein